MQKKILLVDDINFVLELEKELFFEIEKETSSTLEIKTASNVSEALDRLNNDIYDILITDMNLPDGNGADIAKVALKKSSGHTKLVALTSMPIAFEDTREIFDEYFTKPTLPRDIKKYLYRLVTE